MTAETIVRRLMDLITEQAEITNGQVGIIKEDLPTLTGEGLTNLQHAMGVIDGRLQVLRAIESLLKELA